MSPGNKLESFFLQSKRFPVQQVLESAMSIDFQLEDSDQLIPDPREAAKQRQNQSGAMALLDSLESAAPPEADMEQAAAQDEASIVRSAPLAFEGVDPPEATASPPSSTNVADLPPQPTDPVTAGLSHDEPVLATPLPETLVSPPDVPPPQEAQTHAETESEVRPAKPIAPSDDVSPGEETAAAPGDISPVDQGASEIPELLTEPDNAYTPSQTPEPEPQASDPISIPDLPVSADTPEPLAIGDLPEARPLSAKEDEDSFSLEAETPSDVFEEATDEDEDAFPEVLSPSQTMAVHIRVSDDIVTASYTKPEQDEAEESIVTAYVAEPASPVMEEAMTPLADETPAPATEPPDSPESAARPEVPQALEEAEPPVLHEAVSNQPWPETTMSSDNTAPSESVEYFVPSVEAEPLVLTKSEPVIPSSSVEDIPEILTVVQPVTPQPVQSAKPETPAPHDVPQDEEILQPPASRQTSASEEAFENFLRGILDNARRERQGFEPVDESRFMASSVADTISSITSPADTASTTPDVDASVFSPANTTTGGLPPQSEPVADVSVAVAGTPGVVESRTLDPAAEPVPVVVEHTGSVSPVSDGPAERPLSPTTSETADNPPQAVMTTPEKPATPKRAIPLSPLQGSGDGVKRVSYVSKPDVQQKKRTLPLFHFPAVTPPSPAGLQLPPLEEMSLESVAGVSLAPRDLASDTMLESPQPDPLPQTYIPSQDTAQAPEPEQDLGSQDTPSPQEAPLPSPDKPPTLAEEAATASTPDPFEVVPDTVSFEADTTPEPHAVSPDAVMAQTGFSEFCFDEPQTDTQPDTQELEGKDEAEEVDTVKQVIESIEIPAFEFDFDLDTIELPGSQPVNPEASGNGLKSASPPEAADTVNPTEEAAYPAFAFSMSEVDNASPDDTEQADEAEGLDILASADLTDDIKVMVVHHEGIYALMVDNGTNAALLKSYEANPLAGETESFSVNQEAIVGGKAMYIVTVGGWQGILSVESTEVKLQAEL